MAWLQRYGCITAQAQDGEGLNPHGCGGVDKKEEAEAFTYSIHFTNTCGTSHGALCCDGECDTVPVLSGLRINRLGEARERETDGHPCKDGAQCG